jgi:hypothetical protein
MFDLNFSMGSESVFTLKDQEMVGPSPPPEAFLLETDTTPILLTNGTFIALA